MLPLRGQPRVVQRGQGDIPSRAGRARAWYESVLHMANTLGSYSFSWGEQPPAAPAVPSESLKCFKNTKKCFILAYHLLFDNIKTLSILSYFWFGHHIKNGVGRFREQWQDWWRGVGDVGPGYSKYILPLTNTRSYTHGISHPFYFSRRRSGWIVTLLK